MVILVEPLSPDTPRGRSVLECATYEGWRYTVDGGEHV